MTVIQKLLTYADVVSFSQENLKLKTRGDLELEGYMLLIFLCSANRTI